jgi:hypothetical protein
MLCNAALMFRLLNFYSSFKPNFLFEIQVVRESNHSTFEDPLYIFIIVFQFYNTTGHPLHKKKKQYDLLRLSVIPY